MINRERFLQDGLARYYTLKIQEANAAPTTEAASRFVGRFLGVDPALIQAQARDALRRTDIPADIKAEATAFLTVASIETMTRLKIGLENSGRVDPEFLEIAFEDFRARTAENTPTREGTRVISKGEAVIREGLGQEVSTFRTGSKLANEYLTNKKAKIPGLFSGKSKIENLTDFTADNITELINALAVADYQRELDRIEIPNEDMRIKQMSLVRQMKEARPTAPGEVPAFVKKVFPFLEGRPDAELQQIVGPTSLISDRILAVNGAVATDAILAESINKKGQFTSDHMTAPVQTAFEGHYNRLFGMAVLRDRNPKPITEYGTVATLLINEAMTQAKNASDGKVPKNWIKDNTSLLFPEQYITWAADHAEKQQQILREFLQVKQVSAEGEVTYATADERLRTVAETYPAVAESASIFLEAVKTKMFPIFNSAAYTDRALSEAQKLVMTQIIAREMTVTAPAGSALEAIGFQITKELEASTELLRTEGRLPTLETINDLALSAMVHQQTIDGKTQTVPNESLLGGIYTEVLRRQGLEGVSEEAKFNIPLYQVGSDTPINYVTETTESTSTVGTEVTTTRTTRSFYEAMPESEIPKGVLAYTFGTHFYQAADKPLVDKLGVSSPEENLDEEPGTYGTYGAIVQKNMYQEYANVERKKAETINRAMLPPYEGYKYKFLTKSSYYQKKFQEYYQMYMGSGGPVPYFTGTLKNEQINATQKVAVPEQTITETEVQTIPDPIPDPTPYDGFGKGIGTKFTKLTSMHKRLVERTVQGAGKDANRGIYLRNDQGGIDAISFQASTLRRMNSIVAGDVLQAVQNVIDANPDKTPEEVVAELSTATRTIMVGGKEVQQNVVPKGITISPDGKSVSFFGMEYSREINPDTNQATVYTHYNPNGEPVPQSTMITIITHDQPEVRAVATEYMNQNQPVIEGVNRGEAPLIPDDTGVLNAFVAKDPSSGEYGFVPGSEALLRNPSGYDKGTLDKADRSAMTAISKDSGTIVEGITIDDPTL